MASVRAYVTDLGGDTATVIDMAAPTASCLQDIHVPARGIGGYALADIYLASDVVGNAERQLAGYWVVGDLPLMRILQAQGDVDGAPRALREVEQIVRTHVFQMAGRIAFKTARVV